MRYYKNAKEAKEVRDASATKAVADIICQVRQDKDQALKDLAEKFDHTTLTQIRVSKEDIKHYYKIAPIIVGEIDKDNNNDIVYDYIYDNIVDYCVEQIENGNYAEAYKRYKDSVMILEKKYVKGISKIKRR